MKMPAENVIDYPSNSISCPICAFFTCLKGQALIVANLPGPDSPPPAPNPIATEKTVRNQLRAKGFVASPVRPFAKSNLPLGKGRKFSAPPKFDKGMLLGIRPGTKPPFESSGCSFKKAIMQFPKQTMPKKVYVILVICYCC